MRLDADAATVWREIREVPPIRPDELDPSFAYRIGFPRPVEERLEGEGVGAVHRLHTRPQARLTRSARRVGTPDVPALPRHALPIGTPAASSKR